MSTSGGMPPNQAGPPVTYGAYPPLASLNAQTASIGWPNPYMYALFGQPLPFNFLQPPLMLYGGFAQTQHTGHLTGANTTPHTCEEVPMAIDQTTNIFVIGPAFTPQQVMPMAGSSRE